MGIVGRDYQPLQNREAFRWFQPFLESPLQPVSFVHNTVAVHSFSPKNSYDPATSPCGEICETEEMKEGLSTFLEKHQPKFSDR